MSIKTLEHVPVMVTPETRNAVWQELLDIDRCARYYGALSDKYRKKYVTVRILMLVAALVEIIAFLPFSPGEAKEIIKAAAGVLIAASVIWEYFSDYSGKTAILRILNKELGKLEVEWKALWVELPSLDNNVAIRRNTELDRRATEAVNMAVDFNEDNELNQQCTEATYKVMEAKYAAR